jgi:hypothetical protein
MSFWQFLGSLAVSDEGETIQRMGKSNFFSSDGTVFTKTGKSTFGSDGSIFTQTGNFSSDGSSRTGNTANGIGAVFNDSKPRKFGDFY